MRRETSRVLFLMCPFCVRDVLPSQATEHLGRGQPRRRLDDGPLPARRWNRRAALARRWSSRPCATDADPAHTHADRHRCLGLDGPLRTGSCGARRARSPAARASRVRPRHVLLDQVPRRAGASSACGIRGGASAGVVGSSTRWRLEVAVAGIRRVDSRCRARRQYTDHIRTSSTLPSFLLDSRRGGRSSWRLGMSRRYGKRSTRCASRSPSCARPGAVRRGRRCRPSLDRA